MKFIQDKTTVNIAGIQLPCIKTISEDDEDSSNFVYENGTSPYDNIQKLALAVSCNRPVLLQGPVGSGKTCTVEYLAHVTGHREQHMRLNESVSGFVKVQLGEQTDSRMLLGGYQSTEIPGKFVWKPGVLTNAVINGYWILLEDVDSTSSDVVTVIDNLIKNQSLSVPGFGDNIIPHPEFRLFATQRTLSNDSDFSVKCDVLKHWFIIQLKPLNCSELVGIINNKFPSLQCVAKRMVSILDLEHPVQSSDRIPSARDLLKWCKRCSKYFETGSFDVSLKVFQDAVDIFCGYMDKDSESISEQIGIQLGIVKNKAFFLSDRYKPNISVTEKKLLAGRSCLERYKMETIALNTSKRMVFSLTAPSCRLIEKISCCLENNEPVLLVGETGCGKTTVLQYMANVLGRNLIVINMNQQSDTADLIGGFKPVTFRWIMRPLCDKFESLFRKLFDVEKNRDCLNKFLILFNKENWDVLLKFISYVQVRAVNLINFKISKYEKESLKYAKWKDRLTEWEELGLTVRKYIKQCELAERSLVFSFIEGSLVKAVKRGDWVLLDEINLANSETLDCLSGLLENSRGSLLLLEKGENKPVQRDSGFRLFAAMNPATDVGKKRLPVGLRNRFTEFYVDELNDPLDLYPLVESYLIELNYPPERIKKIVNFYIKMKKDSKSNILDGNGKKPHYSLRNLCRALTVASKNLCGSAPRSLYEGLNLSFLTQLDRNSYNLVHGLVAKTATDIDIKAVINQPIPKPSKKECVKMEGFWIPVGNLAPLVPDNYILTDTVKRHLKDIIRITSLGSGIPVLLEGDTSVGKTSLINYLAKCTGNFCARVNNHEHTDIQEYVGTYMADSNGKLVFKEGILCEAMRKGYWLILDELNLAPSEVLEALNRVLDDNRELYIPETQTVIKAHENFILFATQNPPGLYGGRKELSRAFKNRFIELQFSQIPSNELITILEKRCQMPLSYCKKMVAVMCDLQLRRRSSEIFIGKSGFITLRDLFRWGERYQKAVVKEKFHDWEQHLADEGYMLLAGRVRLQEESEIIEEVISKHFKRKTTPHNLFSLHENTSPVSKHILEKILSFSKSRTEFKHVVWTFSMRRLAVLVCKAIEFSEPVLLVGETGCGKTTIVQILALMREQNLFSVNCHTHSDSADFLGGLRPVREESRTKGKLFEWCDGPLVEAMTTGSFFLADEISLADDSVLERLNSLLEPERTILLTEKGGGLIGSESEEHMIVADEKFQFVGTMNPGGDYGKKELSPALRNRFTEIWVEVNNNKLGDYKEIIKFNLAIPEEPLKSKVADVIVNFIGWFQSTDFGKRLTISVRDIMTWVDFMNRSNLEWFESCLHGCCLTFLDALGCGTALANNFEVLNKFRTQCLEFLVEDIKKVVRLKENISAEIFKTSAFIKTDDYVGIHPFYMARGKNTIEDNSFFFDAPTTSSNTLRLLRGLQMNKAILLEGSPGVGKTSLVASLAKASGHKLTRINLSDQTDISDLFGADLPEEGATAGHFVWRDGPFLTALKNGHWILLDELNLALQSVLEGLNAVLDHRGYAFIPELNKTFYISKETKLFACQNPVKEGGSRRGLPKSLLNRFIQVYIEQLSVSDYLVILRNLFPEAATLKIGDYFVIEKMVEFNDEVCKIIRDGKIGCCGGPWEFNLRDITRWVEGIEKNGNLGDSSFVRVKKAVFDYATLLYFNRFRSIKDRDILFDLFESTFGYVYPKDAPVNVFVSEKLVLLGDETYVRNTDFFPGDLNEFEMFCNNENSFGASDIPEYREILKVCSAYQGKKSLENLRLLQKQHQVLRLLSQCVQKRWLAILVGDHGCGKTSCVRVLAALANRKLKILSINSAMDTTEILGGFEQTDYNRNLDNIAESGKGLVLTAALRLFQKQDFERTLSLLKKWLEFSRLPVVDASSADTATAFIKRVDFLNEIMKCGALDFDPKLKEIGKSLSRKLRNLKERQEKEESVTSGGKFEWVDSILIKCMEEGSWLLMEDVNLCSSAVLDRLNSLLEPNGCLTVGERGARADGSLVTIKPHPDFRLFFTMNPKNGAISRAMRNRGVEIYLLPDDESCDWPVQDKLVMLNDVGIVEKATQRALIDFESSRDARNISNLVGNAFWMAQYVKHGFAKSEAFFKSTQQVYKISSEDILNTVRELSLSLNSSCSYSIYYARPPINSYFIDDGFARLKQSCAFLNFLTEVLLNYENAIDKVPVEDLEHFIGYSTENLKISDGIRYSILYIYVIISGPSVMIAPEVISSILKNIERGAQWLKLSDSLRRVIEKPILDELIQLAWDCRWYINSNTVLPLKNKILLLQKLVFSLFHESRGCSQNPSFLKEGTVNVVEYSKAVQESYLEDVLLDYPVMAAYNFLLDGFDDLVRTCLESGDVILNDEQTSWLLDIFKLRFWLGKMSDSPVLTGAKRTPNEEVITEVDFYFLWFCRLFLSGGHTLFMNSPVKDKYVKLVEKLKLAMRDDVSLMLLKISNRFRRELGHPSPDKYLTQDVSPMEIADSNGLDGDPVVLKKVLNNLVQHFHACFITGSCPNELSEFISVTGNEMMPLKSLVEQYKKGDKGLSSELMYHCLDIINSEYEFFDQHDDKAEEAYLKQVLPFHRAAWSCHIVHILFRSPEKWCMINYRNSERGLRNILTTIFPQICSVSEMDIRRNEWLKLSAELARVKENLKKSLDCVDLDLDSFLVEKLKQNLTHSEKRFFEKVAKVVKVILSISVNPDSAYHVYGCLWVLLGLLEVIVLQVARVDPIRKKLLKAKYAKYEVEETEPEIKVFEINSRITGTNLNHPFLLNLRDKLEISKKKISKNINFEKVKRDAVKFKDFCQEVSSFVDITDQVLSFCEGVLTSGETFDQRQQKILCGKARFIRNKNRHFVNNVRKDFINFFGDLAYPFLAAGAQIGHGINLITSELLRRPFPKEIQSLINNFCTYPIPMEQPRNPYHMVKTLSWCARIKDTMEMDRLLLLFSSCRIKCNEYMTFKTEEKYEDLMGLFTIFVEFWKREEEKRLEKKKEEESLYLKRGAKKCETATEEEELEEEQLKLFPTYENDFEENVEEESEDWKSIANPDQLYQIAQMHMKIVKENVRFNWISHKSSNQFFRDFLTPLKLRYLLLSHILPHISFLLDNETDFRLLPGLLVLICAKESDSMSSEVNLLVDENKIYDFYKDKNVSEVNKCLDLLMGLKVRCLELLEQWPEHPALVQMNVVTERILSFSVESPLMKFLTGLEILLQSCQHWESVAHAGVSIADYLISMTNLIIEWRKLELQGWKNCFQTAFIRMNTGALKWWYHIWALIEEYFSEGDKISFDELLQTLYSFIETSPIGEFDTRLDILLSFHCHLTRLEASEKRDKLSIAFWNLYAFYNQYASEVTKKLENLTAPVAKKLKDYVSIAKWNDITYWSVKQAVDKSHRSLLKYIREYEGILKQRIDLKSIDPNPKLDNEKNIIFQDIYKFLRKVAFDQKFRNSKISLKNPDKKFEKASTFCTEIVLTAEYPNLIIQLEYLSQQICENAEYFKDLDVDRTLSKEQQKSHAKSIVHQKRRALADLFKNLKTIGLSYQTGTSLKEFGVLELCQAVPTINSQRVECDKLSGEDYYLKTVSRRLVLDNCLLTPSKEIGPAIIERLRGYASHFMDINKTQKLKLCKFEAGFEELSRYESLLSDLTKNESVAIPDQEMFFKSLIKLQATIDSISYELDQFHLILNSWPGEGDKMKRLNFLGKNTPDIMISSIFEEPYISAVEKFEGIRKEIEKLKKCLESVTSRENLFCVKFSGVSFFLSKEKFSFYYLRDVENYKSCVEELKKVIENIKEFNLKFVNQNVRNCLIESLEKIGKITFDGFDIAVPKKTSSLCIEKDVDGLIQKILLVVQKILKKFEDQKDADTVPQGINRGKEEDGDEEEDEECNIELLEDHLTKKLVGSLESDTEDLNIEGINQVILSILERLSAHAAREGFFTLGSENFLVICSALPFIQQYSILCSYFLEQQRLCYRSCNKLSSILTGVFIQVAQKGFCIPPEYEEDGEGAGDYGSGGGMGLGEGEGTKDVSDRIETEDQLEGAEPQGKEKKDEDRDCKEEEKGIEMSEDFDAKAQDIGKKGDDDEEEEEEEEEEPEVKEMGDVEEQADKLEKELWSSDEENEENENEKKEETGPAQGKQTTENKYAGKENEREEQDQGEQEMKEKKDEIDEINEEEDNGDQIDPFHGRHQPEPEPEPFELPDDMNLDNQEARDSEEEEDNKNPFDIDAMKEVKSMNEEEEKKDDENTEEKQEMEEDSSGDEERNEENVEEPMEVEENGNDEGKEKMDGESDGKELEPEKEEENEEEEKDEKQHDEFEPSDDKPTTQPAQPAPESEKDELASKDEVVGSSNQQQFQTQAQEVTEKPKEESKGTGQAEIENMNDGHEVGASNKEKVQPGQYKSEKEKEKNRKRPGKSDEDRTLAENDVSLRKKLKTLDKLEKDQDVGNNEEGTEESELYEHVNEKVENTSNVIDAATKEQAENQPVPNKEEEEGEEPKKDDVAMDMDEENAEKEDIEELQGQGQKIENFKKKEGQQGEKDQGEEENGENEMQGDIVETATVERGPDTTYHTNPLPMADEKVEPMQVDEILSLKRQIEEQIQTMNKNEGLLREEIEAWHVLNSRVEELSRDLSEQLRLILEPSKATRLKGDFRTGRRINMRKIISYIASEFRKDNIWLRRTKPWKREHEIVLAIDDSSSMDHNNSKELAFESLALVSKSLSLLEAGDLGVISFGERTRVVHPLGEPFTEDSGAKIIREFTFSQNKTLITEMLDVSCSMMGGKKKKGEVCQLLIILSDGRGVFSEGLEKVKLAVRRATDQGIFLVFVIIDEPLSKDSIMDIRMPEFKDGKFLGIKCYLEEFPFPYYMILRDIGALPSTLGDALRQWFQFITSKNP